MGEVWRGHDEAGNVLAFKLLLPHFTSDPGVVARFMRERAILIRVQPPYVVAIHDLVAERGDLAIVMEFIEGSDLRRELQRRRTMPPTEAVGLMIDILAGLGAAHRLGIVHRDLKPENVLLDRSEERFRPKISDFGVAGLMASAATRLTIPGGMLGTPLYMAPESVDGGPIGPAADIYAAGTMLYEMLCGVAPFAGREMLSILRAHADLAPGRPIGIPDELWAVVVAMLAKNPDERPGVDRLQALLPGLVGLPALPPLRTRPSSAFSAFSAFSASYASYASSMASASSAAATVVIAGRPSGPAGPSGAGPAASAGSREPVGWFTPSGPPSPGEPAVLASPIDSADGEFDDPITTPVPMHLPDQAMASGTGPSPLTDDEFDDPVTTPAPVYLPVGAVSPGSGGLAPPGLPDRRSADPATPTAPAKAADLAKAAVPAEAPDMATTQVSARPAGAVQPGRVSASLAGSGKAPRSGPVGTGLPGESTGVPPVRRPPDPAGAGMTAGRSDESGDGTPDTPGRRRSRILAGGVALLLGLATAAVAAAAIPSDGSDPAPASSARVTASTAGASPSAGLTTPGPIGAGGGGGSWSGFAVAPGASAGGMLAAPGAPVPGASVPGGAGGPGPASGSAGSPSPSPGGAPPSLGGTVTPPPPVPPATRSPTPAPPSPSAEPSSSPPTPKATPKPTPKPKPTKTCKGSCGSSPSSRPSPY